MGSRTGGTNSDERRSARRSRRVRDATAVDRRARLGALGVVVAILLFAVTAANALGSAGTAYVWHDNMISDLGDSGCRVRGGRWICSPGFALFNAGLIVTGGCLIAAGGCLVRLWGRLLAGSVGVMGLGLVIAGAFPAGDDGGIHLAGVVLALVAPGCGLLLAGIRPATAWLGAHRVVRGVLGGVALVFCAESRLPETLVPRGAGELLIVGCLVVALLFEAARVLLVRRATPREAGRVSHSAGGTGATASASR